mmetsp:Transcript_89663/g.159257  ORF Transcript_89663/g.159257 Transcript_89663/m.159257 type:complete len:242 (-) Transcript_89663:147-872(-)
MPLVVGYWKIRGLGAPLRMLCEYAGAEYEAKLFEAKGKKRTFEGINKDSWFVDAKPQLKESNALMNLPYVIDGDVVVTQTVACLAYLGRKFKLMGDKPEDYVKVEQILCEAQDLRNACIKEFYMGDLSSWKTLMETVKSSYEKFETWLTQQGSLYTCGATPTAGDFHLWEMLDQLELLAKVNKLPSPLAGFPKLKALHAALRSEPKLQKYFQGELCKLPPNNIMAQFGCEYIAGQEDVSKM